jgi:hypothetical protein
MDCFVASAPRNDGVPDMTSPSRGAMRPRFASILSPKEGAGNAGCTLHPRSRVQTVRKKRTRAYRYRRNTPAFPAQWLYGLYRTLPGERLFCLRHHTRRETLRDLTPAPRRRDHTTLPYASCAFVCCAFHVHRISPHVRDDREAPFIRRETCGVMPLICPTARAEYFCEEGWTDFWTDLPVGQFTAAAAELH